MKAIILAIILWWNILYDYIKPFLNWRFIISFGIAWMITNGWSYVFVILGPILQLKWMTTVGLSYQAFLWLPVTPEKLVTIPIAIWFHRILFPKDFKNLNMFNKLLSIEKSKKM